MRAFVVGRLGMEEYVFESWVHCEWEAWCVVCEYIEVSCIEARCVGTLRQGVWVH